MRVFEEDPHWLNPPIPSRIRVCNCIPIILSHRIDSISPVLHYGGAYSVNKLKFERELESDFNSKFGELALKHTFST